MKRHIATLLVLLFALSAGAAKTTTSYVCSLTNKTVSKCCCTKTKNGDLYCTLAKKTVKPCCCKVVTK